MNVSGDDTVQRGGWIARHSRMAAIADAAVRRSAASARSSRALSVARRGLRKFRSLPPGERTRCALIALTAALAGHILVASILPASASPTIGLTAVALLGTGLAVGVSAK